MKTENFQVLNYAHSLNSWIQPATFLTRNIRWGVLGRWRSWSWAFYLHCCWLICQGSGGTTVRVLPSTFWLACFSGFLVLSSKRKTVQNNGLQHKERYSGTRRKHQVPLKYRHLSTRLHHTGTQKTIILILTTVRTSNLMRISSLTHRGTQKSVNWLVKCIMKCCEFL